MCVGVHLILTIPGRMFSINILPSQFMSSKNKSIASLTTSSTLTAIKKPFACCYHRECDIERKMPM